LTTGSRISPTAISNTLASKLKRGTIESVLVTDNMEVGLEMLLRHLGERKLWGGAHVRSALVLLLG